MARSFELGACRIESGSSDDCGREEMGYRPRSNLDGGCLRKRWPDVIVLCSVLILIRNTSNSSLLSFESLRFMSEIKASGKASVISLLRRLR